MPLITIDGRKPGVKAPQPAIVPRQIKEPPPPMTALGGKLAVIFCFFNPCGYRRPVENAQRFMGRLTEQGVEWFGIELGFHQVFHLPLDPRITRIMGTDLLWHKEALLNIIAVSLPREFTKVAWVDADVLWEDSSWAVQTAELLEEWPVVQLFNTVHLQGSDGSTDGQRPSVARAMIEHLPERLDFGVAHPGFAWAARREFFERFGLLDAHITGGGDSLMALGFYGVVTMHMASHYNPAMRAHFKTWADPVFRYVRGRVGYLNLPVYHLWHGTRADRRYMERIEYLREFDPARSVTRGRNGLYNWTEAGAPVRRLVEAYFGLRKEDGDPA